MDYKIEVLKSSNIIYMRNVGAYGSSANFKMMANFKAWIATNNLQNELETFGIWGIALDNPQETLPEKCRYDVLLCVPNRKKFSLGIKKGVFEGGKYAVFTILHTTEAVQHFWMNIEEHIKNTNLSMRDKPIIERFKEEEGLDKYCEFLVPIV